MFTPPTKEEARARIAELATRFREQYASYKRADYNETQVRRDFIDPFFKALGWDMDNNAGNAEAYREVIHEDRVRIGGAMKAPDYSFRLEGGNRLFFVEAKKPFVKVKSEVEPAYQVRRYAWSAKLPISILTDFEELSVYDCTKRPKPDDKASVARIKYIGFEDYGKEFDFLWDTFSKESVRKGSFDRFVKSDKGKRGTATVDDAFLASLNDWRTYLATSISLRNRHLDEEGINFVVQQTIDRLIFLRIAEDRGVEPYGELMAATKEGGELYGNLFRLFHRADAKYNSGLFDFKKDRLSKGIAIDNKVVRTIVEELYYPKSPYAFSVLSVEILGSAYEQFLGKRIRVDKAHRATIEEKPEVRKAGGVYYTPQYVVDYIVERTLGEKVKGRTPLQVKELKVLDPACGSGSFLLGAYQYLLDWHKAWYREHAPAKGKKRDAALRPDGELTSAVKKEILINNIFGVDLDPNAVEVTKLSLLLKCMEGETTASIQHSLDFAQERILPSLEANILCGNSLIAPDIHDMPGEVDRSIRPFDWHTAFRKVMDRRTTDSTSEDRQELKAYLAKAERVLGELASESDRLMERFGSEEMRDPAALYGMQGGFDVVIGNPPYVRSQFLDDGSKRYFAAHYEPVRYQPDTFALFMVKGIRLLRDGGLLGFIIPNGILTNKWYAPLRHYILTNTAMHEVVDLKDGVFHSASVDTSIFVLERTAKPPSRSHKVRIGEWTAKETNTVRTPENRIEQRRLLALDGHVFNTSLSGDMLGLIDRIKRAGRPLENLVTVKNGMKVRKELVADTAKGALYKPFVVGGDIERFAVRPPSRWVCYDRRLEAKYSNQAFRDEAIFTAPGKLLVRQVYGRAGIHCAVDRTRLYCDQTCYILLPTAKDSDLGHLAGVLGSSLMRFYFDRTLSDRKATFPKIKGDQLKQLPIATGTPAQRKVIATLYAKLSATTDELRTARVPHQETETRHRLAHLERLLNEAVFALYGLNEEEVRLVEAVQP